MVTPSLPPSIIAAFAALTLSLACLWTPRMFVSPSAVRVWIVPGGLALIFALTGGLIDVRGLIALLAFAVACFAANRANGVLANVVTHAIMAAIGAGLFLHVIPGIDNPRVVTDAVLGPGAMAYSKYLNFDKGMAGLFLLGLYAPDRLTSDDGAHHVLGALWRFGVVVAVVMALSLGFGYVRWDPKLPDWWPVWIWSMLALTALPEEVVFRGLVQTLIGRGLAGVAPGRATAAIAMTMAGLLFGVAHIAGGPGYVVVASVAGIGYGWVYASTRSISAAIVTHAGLNTIHFVFFTYPALAKF